jgi:hypothetical protein
VVSACHTKLFSLAALMLISVINSSCTGNTGNRTKLIFTYAEIHASIIDARREILIKRRIYISPDGDKVVFSEISSETGLAVYKITTSRFVSEYLKNDSIFMYDSGDSTCVVLADSDLAETGIFTFPMSAAWLLYNKVNTSNVIKTDTSTIAGCLSRKELVANGYMWIYGQQPVAIETNKNGNIHSETITRYNADTILSESLFRQPLGFRRLLPSN